jgi:hypothetical protein
MSAAGGIVAFGFRTRVAGFGLCTNPFLRGSTFAGDFVIGWRAADTFIAIHAARKLLLQQGDRP